MVTPTSFGVVGRRTALLAGATGLVGGHCLELLLQDDAWEQVAVLGRREIGTTHPQLVQRVVDFDRLAEIGEAPRVDDVFCCLGTTIKRAGSEAAFRRVDFTYVHELARLASRHRAGQFLLVSALGADRQSRVFYNRVKGEVEEPIRELPFRWRVHLPALAAPRRAPGEPSRRAARDARGTGTRVHVRRPTRQVPADRGAGSRGGDDPHRQGRRLRDPRVRVGSDPGARGMRTTQAHGYALVAGAEVSASVFVMLSARAMPLARFPAVDEILRDPDGSAGSACSATGPTGSVPWPR
ncbi:MAG: hypothetical protein ACREYE_07380 [Gammaproteobacteria bacterium]